MRTVRLLEYRKVQSGVLFDVDKNTVVSPIASVPDSLQGFSGFYDVRSIGLWRKQRVTAALYLTSNEEAKLVVGTFVAVLKEDTDCDVRLSKKIPLQRQFTVTYRGAIMAVRYWWLQSETWPDDGDIFRYISEAVSGSDGVRQFVSLWKQKRDP